MAPWLLSACLVVSAVWPCWLQAQHVRLERCEPAVIQSGVATEIRLHGGGLEAVSLWASFPAEIERIAEDEPLFRISTDHLGPGALRVHSDDGVSNLVYMRVEDGGDAAVASQGKTSPAAAQEIVVPITIEGSSQNLGAHFFRFGVKKGESVILRAEARDSDFDGVLTLRTASGRRIAQADDSQIDGLNPRIHFTAPEEGHYIVELMDSEYRGGKGYQLWIEEPEKNDDAAAATVASPFQPGVVEEVETREGVLGRHVIGASAGVSRFPLHIKKRVYLTLVAAARKLRSPALPRIRILKESGELVAESSREVFDEQDMQIWLDAGDYRIEVRDAYGRRGPEMRFELTMHAGTPPFSLSVAGQKDKKHPLVDNFLAVPGGVFVVPVQCSRKEFTPEVRLHLESSLACIKRQDRVPDGKGSAGFRLRLPSDAVTGTLHTFGVRGVSELEGSSYEARLETIQILKERDENSEIPESVNGLLAVRVMEPPLKVEVTSPGEIMKGDVVKVPVALKWEEGGRRFSSKVRMVGLPAGIESVEKRIDDKTSSVELELKVGNPEQAELTDLVVEVEIDFHRHPLRIESPPISLKLRDKS